MAVELLTPFLACFALILFLQIFLCFKMRKGVWKGLPLVIDLLALFYAGARFFGIIRYADDTAGILEGGLASGIFISIMAITGLIGIVLAWLIYFFISWKKARNTGS